MFRRKSSDASSASGSKGPPPMKKKGQKPVKGKMKNVPEEVFEVLSSDDEIDGKGGDAVKREKSEGSDEGGNDAAT